MCANTIMEGATRISFVYRTVKVAERVRARMMHQDPAPTPVTCLRFVSLYGKNNTKSCHAFDITVADKKVSH